MVDHFKKVSYMLRPANYPYSNPGRGWTIANRDGFSLGVIIVMGQAGFPRVHLRNPFVLLPELIKKISETTPNIIIEYHAETTAEKNSLFQYLDGQVSAIIGTHTRALSADERLMPAGTAVITDAGRTGSINSVGGMDSEIEIRKYISQIPEYSKAAFDSLELQGVLIDIDQTCGKARSIARLRIPCKDTINA